MSDVSPEPSPRRSLTGAIVPALAAAGLAALGALFMVSHQQQPAIGPRGCTLRFADKMGGPISLQNTDGRQVTQANFSSRPSIIFFGFTHCPDFCPNAMYAVGEALKGAGAPDIQPILISVDPERDTPARLGEYIHTDGFPPNLVGLTGTPEQVRAAANAFNAQYRKSNIEGVDPAEAYNVDHSTLFYVMDERWRTRASMSSIGATPEDIAACIQAGLSRRD